MPEINSQTNGKYAELPVRILSAVVLAAFALFCTWMGDETFALLAIALSLVVFYEFRQMTRSQLPFLVSLFALVFLILLFGSYFVGRQSSGIAIIVLAALVLMAWEWVRQKSTWGGILLLYAGLPFSALVDLRAGYTGLFTVLFVFACVWGADTLAYFFGKTFGGPKLAPSISPNKTWSGFIGGLVGAVLISAILTWAMYYPITGLSVGLAIVLSLFSQGGDLFESWVKRRFGLKDSGKIIPGHGGLLDRVDGLIFAIVALWLIVLAFTTQTYRNGTMSDILVMMLFS